MPHQRVDLTEGNLSKGILTLAWPVIVANLLQTAYNNAGKKHSFDIQLQKSLEMAAQPIKGLVERHLRSYV